MINIVIDANVFKALFEEDIGLPSPRPERTGIALTIPRGKDPARKIGLDESGQIEHEYSKMCTSAPEWFSDWLAAAFQTGLVTYVNAKVHATTAKKVEKHGFPKGNKDLWYIKTAYGLRDANVALSNHLISEDVDFYDPTKKGQPNKAKTLVAGKGPVAKEIHLENVSVCCLQTFNSLYP